MTTHFYLKAIRTLKLFVFLCLSCFSFFESKCQTIDSSKFATVYFIREKDLMESATAMTIKINDSLTVKLKNNSYQIILFNPSEIKISLVRIYLFNDSSGTIKLHAGEKYYFKYFREKDDGGVPGDPTYTTYLRQVSDKVALNSIKLIDLNAENKASTKLNYVKIERNALVKDRPLNPDSSYIYFIRPNVFYGGGVPFKISISDDFAFLLPNNTRYIHATTASEVDIISHLNNNNMQNGILHVTLEKGKAYYVYVRQSFENGAGATLIRMDLIDEAAYREKVQENAK